MADSELQKRYEEYRADIHRTKKTLLEFSQQCDIIAEKESDPEKKKMLMNMSTIATQMEDIYNNIESSVVTTHIARGKLDDLLSFIFRLKEVQENSDLKRQISKILSKDYT